jgi:carbamoyl-phosphate synthase small subunit
MRQDDKGGSRAGSAAPADETGAPAASSPWAAAAPTALLVLADGSVIEGEGVGAAGAVQGELCFNTAITGYQEILTDPSYAGQIVTFTFPHIGNVGANIEDVETLNPAPQAGACGCVLRARVTRPSNHRAMEPFDAWLKARGVIGMCGVDTRALTTLIRERGMQNVVIAHNPHGGFEIEALKAAARDWPGIEGAELAASVTSPQVQEWTEATWRTGGGFSHQAAPEFHVVAIDYGVKRNILRCLAAAGCRVTLVPASAKAEDILQLRPDGVFLSNGPGDPAATGVYAVPEIRKIVEADMPVFGICLGHQMLALALGARTRKMAQGHHGANHPVMDYTTSKVEITSMNHGFTVERDSLPANVEETHRSLFDGTNCGIRLKDKPVFSVQYHPEASPGPQDSHYLFRRFVNMLRLRRQLQPAEERKTGRL